MFFSSLAVLALAATASAQSVTTSAVVVPTGTPVEGDYTGALRPQVHFSPPKYFMNDPNGMFVDANGTWHLYYQYNPTSTVAGNQHWGHATSEDLYHWTNQPIAIFPGNSSEGIFSGSAVIDVNNTSGFFPNQTDGVVAIYTLNTPYSQTQQIAYSTDGGYTFEKYSGNPVIEIGSTQFRDPKVIWYQPTESWVMVIAYAQEFVIGVYTSPDLKDWTHASNFSHHGLLGIQYECPNMVEMPILDSEETIWLLAISINPGAPLGGSITEYFPGSFNGTHFEAVDNAARIADFGKDNYAGQWFYGIPANEPQVSIGWASNWQYAQTVPTGPLETWRSSMSVPRVNYIANITRLGWDLISLPYDLSPITADPANPIASNSSLNNATLVVDYSTVSSGALYFNVSVTGLNSTIVADFPLATLNMTFLSSVSTESVSFGQYFSGDNPFFLNRGNINGFGQVNPFFTDKFSTNILYPTSGDYVYQLEGVIDRSILEVFIEEGARSATTTFFPEEPLDTIIVKTGGLPGGVEVAVNVWALESGWETGTESANATSSVKRDFMISSLI